MKRVWMLGACLFLSLAANAFLIGIVMSRHLPPQQPKPVAALMENLEEIPEPTREEIRAIYREYQPQIHEHGKKMRELRTQASEALHKKEYSRRRMEELFAKMQEEGAAMQALAQKMTLEIADKLPADKRGTLMKAGQ